MTRPLPTAVLASGKCGRSGSSRSSSSDGGSFATPLPCKASSSVRGPVSALSREFSLCACVALVQMPKTIASIDVAIVRIVTRRATWLCLACHVSVGTQAPTERSRARARHKARGAALYSPLRMAKSTRWFRVAGLRNQGVGVACDQLDQIGLAIGAGLGEQPAQMSLDGAAGDPHRCGDRGNAANLDDCEQHTQLRRGQLV